MSVEEYLEFELNSPIRHEYVAGEVFAMTGATARHNLINLNLTRLFHAAAKKRGCRVLAIEIMLRAASDRYYYPDLIVACGLAGEVERIVEEPTVVVEITSPSTRATDRREKLDAYQRMPSVRTYLVVEQRRRQLFVYNRAASGEFSREEINGAGEVVIPALGTTFTLDEIYDDVPLPPLRVGEREEWDEDEFDDA
jgi:Uma2 family endonuclease